jgi:hypothetical protein
MRRSFKSRVNDILGRRPERQAVFLLKLCKLWQRICFTYNDALGIARCVLIAGQGFSAAYEIINWCYLGERCA